MTFSSLLHTMLMLSNLFFCLEIQFNFPLRTKKYIFVVLAAMKLKTKSSIRESQSLTFNAFELPLVNFMYL